MPQITEVFDDTPSWSLAPNELRIGDGVFQHVTFTEEMLLHFGQIARDEAPIHTDVAFARKSGFDRPIIQGMAVASRFSRLIGMYLPGRRALLQAVDLKYRKPTFLNDPLTYRVTIERVIPSIGSTRLALLVEAPDGINVEGYAQCQVR